MSARSEQLVLDYLSRAADAAHGTLRSDERVRFITRLRASIEQQRQLARAVEPAQVRRVLQKFGDPKVLAERERRSLVAAAAAAAAPVVPAPVVPAPVVPAPVVPAPVVPAPVVPAPVMRAGPGRIFDRADGKRAVRALPISGPYVQEVPRLAFDPMSVAPRFRREMLSLALLAPGGLLAFPLWLIGAVIGLTSRVWSTRDRFIGLAGPLIITAAGLGVIGTLNKNPSITVDFYAYAAAAHSDASLLMRISAMLGALYLGARLPRGEGQGPARRSSANRRRDLPGGR